MGCKEFIEGIVVIAAAGRLVAGVDFCMDFGWRFLPGECPEALAAAAEESEL